MQAKYKTEAIILLTEWMRANKMSIAKLSRALKSSYPTTWALFQRDRRPHLDTAIKIEHITSGAVPCISWELLKSANKPSKKTTKNHQKKNAD